MNSEKIDDLILKYSIDDILESKFLKDKFENPNICIFPGRLEIAIQMYESTTNFKELNTAITLKEYEECFDIFQGDSFYIFMKFIQKFKKNVLEVKKFCNHKKFIVFPLHIAFFDNYKKQIKFAGHHASLAILDQDKNIIYMIDSDNIENIESGYITTALSSLAKTGHQFSDKRNYRVKSAA
jgi:hypothetical protein